MKNTKITTFKELKFKKHPAKELATLGATQATIQFANGHRASITYNVDFYKKDTYTIWRSIDLKPSINLNKAQVETLLQELQEIQSTVEHIGYVK